MGTAVVFSVVAVLHFFDPSHIASLGLPSWAAYVIGLLEILAVVGMFVLADTSWVEVGLTAITLGAIGLYIKTGQYELIALPGIALGHCTKRPSYSQEKRSPGFREAEARVL